MRIYFIYLWLGLLLAGCAPRHIGSFSAEGVTPKQEMVIAEDAAGKITAEYPPGVTALHLEQARRGHFDTSLESRLRERGFRLEASGGSGILSVAYTLDAIKDEPNVWYLHVKTSDGFSFSRVYALGPDTKPDGGMVQTASPEKRASPESENVPVGKVLPQ
jgi:hypothetical protein